MAQLDTDTLYYRGDHPRGYMFAAGQDEPDPAEGWAAAPEHIAASAPQTFECTTFEAYAGLLKSEREGHAETKKALGELMLKHLQLSSDHALQGQEMDNLRAALAQAQSGEGK